VGARRWPVVVAATARVPARGGRMGGNVLLGVVLWVLGKLHVRWPRGDARRRLAAGGHGGAGKQRE
jgi:hypothetical protein